MSDRYLVAEVWESTGVRFIKQTPTSLQVALDHIQRSQELSTGKDYEPTHYEIYELKAKYPALTQSGNLKFPNV